HLQWAKIPPNSLPGTTLRVIGAGLPRSALRCCLPQCRFGIPPRRPRLPQLDAKLPGPIRIAFDRGLVLELMKERLGGYIATADTPGTQFVPDLLALYSECERE
ncbi:hypothetical protein K432DRAFT_463682, partial [Lepidopterella palustris CBS 459.81]